MKYPENFFSVLLGNPDSRTRPADRAVPVPKDLRLADALLDHIPAGRSEIIRLHYRDGLSFREIGKRRGVTHERTRQICISGLNRIRKHLRELCGSRPPDGTLDYETYASLLFRAAHFSPDSPVAVLGSMGLPPGMLAQLETRGTETVLQFASLTEEELTAMKGVGPMRLKRLTALQNTVKEKLS